MGSGPSHWTTGRGLEPGEACPRTSQYRSPKCVALGMAVVLLPRPDRTFPREGHPPKRFPVVQAPCPSASDADAEGDQWSVSID